MKIKYGRRMSFVTALLIAVSSFSYPVYADETSEIVQTEEQIISDETVSEQEDEQTLEDENWLSVATEVITYYAEKSAGLEPLITENNLIFYDVVADRKIDLGDAAYFLDIYAMLSAGMEFEGYIPKRNGELSPVTTTTTTTTTTSASESTATPVTTTVSAAESSASTETTTSSTTIKTTSVSKTTAKTTSTASTKTSVNTTSGSAVCTSSSSGTTTTKSATTTKDTATETTSQTTTETSTETTEVVTRTPLYYGIDVSVYQGSVDWQQVKDSGVDFAIIRAGYGKHANQEDRYFDINMKNAQELGIDCGAYWFSYALTPEDAEKEADAFYEVIKDYKFEYPVFFDYETSDQFNLKPEESTAIIHAFCDRMESYGYYVSLCSYVGFLNYRIESEIFDCFDTWIAHYDVKVPWYSRNYGIWQYSCKGQVPGINYDVDLNYAYYDYPSIMKECNLNGF